MVGARIDIKAPPGGSRDAARRGVPPPLCPLLGFGGGSVPRLHHVFGGRGLGGEEAVGGRGRGSRRGSTAQGRLKVNRLVKEPVAEENHQGEETELEVAEREESWSAPDAGKLPPEEFGGRGAREGTLQQRGIGRVGGGGGILTRFCRGSSLHWR